MASVYRGTGDATRFAQHLTAASGEWFVFKPSGFARRGRCPPHRWTRDGFFTQLQARPARSPTAHTVAVCWGAVAPDRRAFWAYHASAVVSFTFDDCLSHWTEPQRPSTNWGTTGTFYTICRLAGLAVPQLG